MARIQKPTSGHLIISVIHCSLDALADALAQLERRFGRVEFETIDIPHVNGAVYAEEMGNNLMRRFFSFERLVPRDSLIEVKGACHKIESTLGDQVDDFTFRTVNIDPGLLTPLNLVMASHRELGQRVYLGSGVYAHVELVYSRCQFVRLPWTDPDFCHDEAIDLFLRARENLTTIDVSQEPIVS